MRAFLKPRSIFVILLLGLAAVPASAQTVAPGPYYATPSWDQTFPASTRFIVLSNFSSEAVLDRETGLVWERTPAFEHTVTTPTPGGNISFPEISAYDWLSMRNGCLYSATGGRKGWRLPSVHELSSLIGIPLPSGHPFRFGSGTAYDYDYSIWTATTDAADEAKAWRVSLKTGSITSETKATFGFGGGLQWCVRGSNSVEKY